MFLLRLEVVLAFTAIAFGGKGPQVLLADWREIVVQAKGHPRDVSYNVSVFDIYFDRPMYLNGTSIIDVNRFLRLHDRHRQIMYGIVSLECNTLPPIPSYPNADVYSRNNWQHGQYLLPLPSAEDSKFTWLNVLTSSNLYPELYSGINRISYALLTGHTEKGPDNQTTSFLHFPGIYDDESNCTLVFLRPEMRGWRITPGFLTDESGYHFTGEISPSRKMNQDVVSGDHMFDNEENIEADATSFLALQTGNPAYAMLMNVLQRVPPLVTYNVRNHINADVLSVIIVNEVGPYMEFSGPLPPGTSACQMCKGAFLELEESQPGKPPPPPTGQLTLQTTDLIIRLVIGGVLRDLTQFWTQEIGSRMIDYLTPVFVKYCREETTDLLEGALVKSLNHTIRHGVSGAIRSPPSVSAISTKLQESLLRVATRSLTHSLSHTITHSLMHPTRDGSHDVPSSCLQCARSNLPRHCRMCTPKSWRRFRQSYYALAFMDNDAARFSDHFSYLISPDEFRASATPDHAIKWWEVAQHKYTGNEKAGN